MYLKCAERIGEVNLLNLKENKIEVKKWAGYNFWMDDEGAIFTTGEIEKRKSEFSVHIKSIGSVFKSYENILSITKSNNAKIIGFTFEKKFKNSASSIVLISTATGKILGNFKNEESQLDTNSIAIDDDENLLFVEYENGKIVIFNIYDKGFGLIEMNLNPKSENIQVYFLAIVVQIKTK